MRHRISPATVISIVALFFALTNIASAGQPSGSTVIRATQETTHFQFYARSRRVETECEPTTAKALLMDGHRVAVPALFSNRADNGSVYVYERHHSTCASLVNWTAHRERVHFTLVLLNTTTRL